VHPGVVGVFQQKTPKRCACVFQKLSVDTILSRCLFVVEGVDGEVEFLGTEWAVVWIV
jgi:hypothetical protein